VAVEADATAIPGGFEVDISGFEIGSSIVASEIKLPEGVTLVTDGEALVVSGLAAPTAEQLDAELAEAEAEVGAGAAAEAPAEGEEVAPEGDEAAEATDTDTAQQPAEA
jgi:large subunit ribosomal protein L25